jgi:hypothetical protein
MFLATAILAISVTESAISAPPRRDVSHDVFTGPIGNRSDFVAPTPDLTAVANALQVQAKSLTTLLTVSPGLALTKPVTISTAYLSVWPSNNNRITQTYTTAGNQILYVDPEGDGKPRKLHLDITLSEPKPGGGLYNFNVPIDLMLEPLYDVSIGTADFRLVDGCNLIGDSEINFYWFTPDGQKQNRLFFAPARQNIGLSDFSWSQNEVGASANLRMPSHLFRTVNTIDLHEILGGFAPGLSPSVTNLVPGKTRTFNPGLENAVNEHDCKATVIYKISYQLRAYFGAPTVRDHR